jgi:uncharacterized protein (TIGR02646 family)
MIKINKQEAPPDLIAIGLQLTNEMKANFDLYSAEYQNANKIFNFTSAYKSNVVKDALRKNQHNKCCFSEAKFVRDDAHVEHFRPKGRIDDWPKGDIHYPGYYWLAYEWSNLFLCKSTTNSSNKRNFFPLEEHSLRNRTHHDTGIEITLLIDPSVDEPRDHINFKGDEPVGLTKKGKTTIELLKLRSPDLEEARRTKLGHLIALKKAVDLLLLSGMDKGDPEIIDLLAPLRYAIRPEAEFSSMAVDFLSGWPHL